MMLEEQFLQYIGQESLFGKRDKLLLAVSGGVDSVVLCELCAIAGYDFTILHCNFQLRGTDSDEDEVLVKRLAKKYAKEVVTARFETSSYAVEHKISIQVAARVLRYDWFESIRLQQKDPAHSWILTAHHADDNMETAMMNFFKGTGMAGLRGIIPKQKHIVRPLLFAGKEEIKTYAAARHLVWREDSSNESDKYTRNYFRNSLIPAIEKVYPQVKENMRNNLPRLREVEIVYKEAVERYKKKLMQQKGSEIYLPVGLLQKVEPLSTVLFEIVKDYGFHPAQLPDILTLLKAATGKYVTSSSHRIFKNREWLIISPLTITATGIFLVEQEGATAFPAGTIQVRKLPVPETITHDPFMALVDAKTIAFPILLRTWKAGDYFYPLGLGKKKKIARFLIDQKLSKSAKEDIWVLEMDKKIIWIPGLRMDDRVKLTTSTKEVYELKWVKKLG